MSFYQQTLDLFDLNGRQPMSEDLLIKQGARNIRASDANIVRAEIWRNHKEDLDKLLSSTFHSYELDRQMSMRWMLDNQPDAFFNQRDAEIQKGQGRVDKNHWYKEVGYKYLISRK